MCTLQSTKILPLLTCCPVRPPVPLSGSMETEATATGTSSSVGPVWYFGKHLVLKFPFVDIPVNERQVEHADYKVKRGPVLALYNQTSTKAILPKQQFFWKEWALQGICLQFPPSLSLHKKFHEGECISRKGGAWHWSTSSHNQHFINSEMYIMSSDWSSVQINRIWLRCKSIKLSFCLDIQRQ